MTQAAETYTKEHRQFYLPIPDRDWGGQRVYIAAPKHTSEDTAIRLYCTMYKQSWSLQLRGFFQDRNYKKGKTWYYANATLGREELIALRDACNAALEEV